MRRRVARAVLVLLLFAVAAVGGGWFYSRSRLQASLPVLDGRITLEQLHGPVTVARDALGIPTIRATSREDVARVTGFLHAQDRFFQMDLARRRAAGELAELVGPRALEIDRQTRRHRFRAVARRTVASLPAAERQVLSAYVAGVNTGLSRLAAPPFEYLLLQQDPRQWSDEDSILVVLAMFLTLQDGDGFYDATIATMSDVLPPPMVEFLVPRGTEWDSPIVGEAFAVPPVPGPDVYNLRARRSGRPEMVLPPPRPEPVRERPGHRSPVYGLSALTAAAEDWRPETKHNEAIGSNNFAVAGRLTDTGAALVANDMHLGVRVPSTWYRAVYEWTDPTRGTHLVVGATLPGHPAMVIGSNTHTAWGFTNTYGDFADVVIVETDPQHPGMYRTPSGWQRFELHHEVIKVANEPDVPLLVTWTIWGPVIDPDHAGRARALKWLPHSLDQLDNTLTPFESAHTLEELFDQANGLGAPAQNIVAGDRSGRIGWSIFGAIPRRLGTEGHRPTSWSSGSAGWNGWLADRDYPRVIDPPSGRIWTANARVADAETTLGHANYEIGSRARIIRDRLFAREQFAAGDLLGIQLDTSAAFLARWRQLLLQTLSSAALRDHPDRAELRDVVERGWTGQVTADSAAYRLTRMFRERTSERVFGFLLSECYEADAAFDYRTIRLREGPIWKVVTEQPLHLLEPSFDNWQQLLLSSVDDVLARVRQDFPGPLTARAWGEMNRTVYRHPLSSGVPFLARWLDMPAEPLPGDLYTPNMHWGSNAPSERMVVSPGRESEGIMHIPAGQSGHPLSPYYSNSHRAWVTGAMTPLMPGRTEHLLAFTP
jgi:penicillin G amidase